MQHASRIYKSGLTSPLVGLYKNTNYTKTFSPTLFMAANMKNRIFAATILLWQMVMGLTPAEWRSQSIYFLLTDRFGRSDNSVTATCNVNDRVCASFNPGCSIDTLTTRIRFIAVVVGRVLSTKYISNLSLRIHILTSLPVGLYPGNGLYCHLDHSSDKTALTKHWRWYVLSWVLAARYVRLLNG